MSMSEEEFGGLVDEIVALGYDEATAGRYAALIGDTPIVDEEGRVCVMEKGEVVARLKLEVFGKS